MKYNIRKSWNDFEGKIKYNAIEKPPFWPSVFKSPNFSLSPYFDTAEEVVEFMDNKSQEVIIDPEQIRIGQKN